ncbi:MAG: type II secretion system protein [Chthoniobacteraceae bacterium]|jgi:prepilin-type N-terminal cleavage/methylation domain-containing protein
MPNHRSPLRLPGGFTLVELLTVMAVIAILAGLVLSLAGLASKKAALNRAQGEIQALSAACEAYKADNGTYPRQNIAVSGSIPPLTSSQPAPSDQLDPRTNGNSASINSTYANASLELYEALTGDLTCTGTGGGVGVKNYVSDGFKPDVLGRINPSEAVGVGNTVTYLSDPFGNCYGYSTANSTAVMTGSSYISGQGYNPAGTPPTMPGFNPTFDLWCTAGQTSNPNPTKTADQAGDVALQWIKNW